MNVFSAKQLREEDRATLEKQDISSTDLMERAASLVFEEIDKRQHGADIPVNIIYGIGSNVATLIMVRCCVLDKSNNLTFCIWN